MLHVCLPHFIPQPTNGASIFSMLPRTVTLLSLDQLPTFSTSCFQRRNISENSFKVKFLMVSFALGCLCSRCHNHFPRFSSLGFGLHLQSLWDDSGVHLPAVSTASTDVWWESHFQHHHFHCSAAFPSWLMEVPFLSIHVYKRSQVITLGQGGNTTPCFPVSGWTD